MTWIFTAIIWVWTVGAILAAIFFGLHLLFGRKKRKHIRMYGRYKKYL
jgi:hypothetical protein